MKMDNLDANIYLAFFGMSLTAKDFATQVPELAEVT